MCACHWPRSVLWTQSVCNPKPLHIVLCRAVLCCAGMQIERPTRVLLAHAILMLIAFGVLLPSGLLLARHKWLFMDAEQVCCASERGAGPSAVHGLAAHRHCGICEAGRKASGAV